VELPGRTFCRAKRGGRKERRTSLTALLNCPHQNARDLICYKGIEKKKKGGIPVPSSVMRRLRRGKKKDLRSELEAGEKKGKGRISFIW